MKNKRALEIDQRTKFCASSEKLNFTKQLVRFWRDLKAGRLALAFHDTWFESAMRFRAKDFKFSVLRYNGEMAG